MTTSNSALVFVDKPAGVTSHDVVATLRRLFKTRRVGHGGTLDPMATGLLIIGIEAGTKLLQFVTDAPKSYVATVRLGQSTITDDAEGEVLSNVNPLHLSNEEILAAFASQVGWLDQVPSSVSAIKINGERAYAKVRAGEDVQLAARRVQITRLDVVAIQRSAEFVDVQIEVDCSKGTYIRAIARDVGNLLRVGGHLTSLRRTRIGGVEVTEATEISAATGVALAQVVARFMPCWVVAESDYAAIQVGRNLDWPAELGEDLPAVALLSADSSAVLAIAKPVDVRGEIKIGYHSVLNSENS